MRLRRARFGERLSVWADCDGCGERMSLELAAGDLPEAGEAAARGRGRRATASAGRRAATSRRLPARARRRGGGAGAVPRLRASRPTTLPEGAALDALMPRGGGGARRGGPLGGPDARGRLPGLRASRRRSALDVPGLVWDEIAAVARAAGRRGARAGQRLRLGRARHPGDERRRGAAAYLARVGA